jgi:glycosyltransferase involved in cell wall biosynthesis
MRAYAETDVVVMPSTLESFGIVGLEALMCNCALVAREGLGMDSYMPKSLATSNTTEGIIAVLKYYIDNRGELSNKQSENYFRNLVDKAEFDSETMALNYINVWEKMRNNKKN